MCNKTAAHIKILANLNLICTTPFARSGQPPAAGNDSARHIIPSHATLCQFAASGRLLLFFQRFSVSKRAVGIRHACRGRVYKHRQHRQRHGYQLKRIAEHRADLLPDRAPRGEHRRVNADRRQCNRRHAHPKPRVFHSHRNIDFHAFFAPFTVPRARAGTRSPPQALPR